MTLRRDFLGFTAGAVAARTVLPIAARAETPPFVHAMSPAHPDAALIAACMAHRSACDAVDAKMSEPCDSVDWTADAELAAENEALSVVADIRAMTLIGVKAKARAILAAFDRDIPTYVGSTVEDEATAHELAAYRLLHDVLILGAA